MNIISQRGRFCAVCGSAGGPFLDNLCEKCYKKENPLEMKKVDSLKVEICSTCGSLRILGAHTDTQNREEGLEEVIREVARRAILENIDLDSTFQYDFTDNIEESKIMNYGVKEFEINTRIVTKPYEEFSEFEEEFRTRLKMLRSICDDCSKYKSGYFEAILQVRGDNRKLTEKEEEEIEQQIENKMKQYEDARLAYILDFEVDQDGITAQVSTKFLAETLAREIKNFTSGKLTTAYEHKTTSKDGAEVYTNTYLVKLPEFAKGDIVEYERILWVVKNVSDALIKMESLETHEIKKIDRKRVESQASRRNNEIIEREYMLVSVEGQTVIIMAMDNYENIDDNLERVPRNKGVGENIKGFLIEEKNYYIE
ncbi:MAG: hypothetical protein KAS63_00220 [Candidatus Heimdallarchaeota archaeon]|nr:hypothetical protein [Candidatus Heimdallarchaeota archaeon]MCK4953767.1 hypothetical protein [Candidatus Heimdallarchaeota archaeon]